MKTEDRARIRQLIDIYGEDFERALNLEGPFKDEGYLMNKRIERIIDYLSLLGVKRLLDVGCGPGVVAVKINKRLGIEVDAVDFSEKQVEKARRLVAWERAKVRVFHEDILAPSPSSGLRHRSYDIVLCKDVLGAYRREEKKEFIEELIKYVKLKGHLIMSVLSYAEGVESPYSEPPNSYTKLLREIAGKEPYIERMDEHALLLDVRL